MRDVNLSWFKVADRCVMKPAMERIDPQADHERLRDYAPGSQVRFDGKPYTVARRTTLASGEPALVLTDEKEQFVISASRFFDKVGSGK